MSLRPTRRAASAGLLLAPFSPAAACADTPEAAWLAYDARLRRGAADLSVRFDAEIERDLTASTNALRRKAGAAPMTREPELDFTARAQAADLLLRGYFDHPSPEGFAPSSRVALLARGLLGSVAENIAAGHGPPEPTGEALARFWFDSPGHRANMLKPSHGVVGHGLARRDGRFAAVAVFMSLTGRLARPLPLVWPAAALRPALEAASPPVRVFSLEAADAGAEHDHRLEPVEGEPPAGFRRLRPFTPDGGGGWSIGFGPVVALR